MLRQPRIGAHRQSVPGRSKPYNTLRCRPGGIRCRIQRHAVGGRFWQHRCCGALAWPLGPCRRIADGAGTDRESKRQPPNSLLSASWYVPPARIAASGWRIVANPRSKGIIVFTACSHAGLVNVLKHARSTFPSIPLHAVVGGFHLAGGNEKIIAESVKDIGDFGLAMIAPGHCTGWRAVNALVTAYGDRVVVPLAVGKIFAV